ncbi:MAG: NHL repeat-containing protein, partial [Turicibacter sp.]
MKKGRIYHVIFTLFTLGFLITSQFNINAEVPYKTRTFGPNGKLVETQMAYEPNSVIKLPSLNAEDLFLAPDQTMYVADTGNGRIIVLKDGVIHSTIGEGILENPTGIYVDKKIYVADSVAQKVFVFDLDGNLALEIGRPESPLFGKNTKFIPKKVTVDSRGNIYVVSEGSTDGLVQLNNRGEFTGFFASNLTNTTLKMMVQRLLYGNVGSSSLMKNLPPSPTNATIDETGLIYTVSSGLKEDQIKKFNVSGKNMLAEKVQVPPTSFIDVTVDSFGNIFGIDELGYIYELDSYGNLLFMFGGKEKGEERVGLMKSPVAVAASPEGTLYVLDKEKNMIQLYQPTPFTHEVHEGISLYKEGLYVESESIWDNVLKRNSLFILSYQAL